MKFISNLKQVNIKPIKEPLMSHALLLVIKPINNKNSFSIKMLGSIKYKNTYCEYQKNVIAFLAYVMYLDCAF